MNRLVAFDCREFTNGNVLIGTPIGFNHLVGYRGIVNVPDDITDWVSYVQAEVAKGGFDKVYFTTYTFDGVREVILEESSNFELASTMTGKDLFEGSVLLTYAMHLPKFMLDMEVVIILKMNDEGKIVEYATGTIQNDDVCDCKDFHKLMMEGLTITEVVRLGANFGGVPVSCEELRKRYKDSFIYETVCTESEWSSVIEQTLLPVDQEILASLPTSIDRSDFAEIDILRAPACWTTSPRVNYNSYIYEKGWLPVIVSFSTIHDTEFRAENKEELISKGLYECSNDYEDMVGTDVIISKPVQQNLVYGMVRQYPANSVACGDRSSILNVVFDEIEDSKSMYVNRVTGVSVTGDPTELETALNKIIKGSGVAVSNVEISSWDYRKETLINL